MIGEQIGIHKPGMITEQLKSENQKQMKLKQNMIESK